jgi:hypothetical protein
VSALWVHYEFRKPELAVGAPHVRNQLSKTLNKNQSYCGFFIKVNWNNKCLLTSQPAGTLSCVCTFAIQIRHQNMREEWTTEPVSLEMLPPCSYLYRTINLRCCSLRGPDLQSVDKRLVLILPATSLFLSLRVFILAQISESGCLDSDMN